MTRLHYDVHPGKGPAMLMVHGLLCSRALWDLNLKALGSVCTPVTVELFGHGRSPAPTDTSAYTPDNYVAELELIRQDIGASKLFLCGHSLGAALTIRYGLKYPHYTLAHVFTNSSSAFAPPRKESRPPASLIKHFESGGLDVIEKIPVHPKYGKWLPDEIQKALVKDSALINPGSIARTIGYTHPDVSLQDHFDENIPPALLVCGSLEGRFAPLRNLVEQRMPNTRIVDVKGGHAVNAECSEEFNAAVRDFLSQYL